MALRRSNIGYTDPEDPRPVYGWNPGGFGCSGGCDGCWAKRMSGRMTGKCSRCAAFEVHLHPERLGDPAKTKKPGVVLVNFTCDTFDKARPAEDVASILKAAAAAPQHRFVFLTKNAKRKGDLVSADGHAPLSHCYWGLSVRNQSDVDAKLKRFLVWLGRLWVSYEPAWGPIAWENVWWIRKLAGVIVGHDNRRGASGTETLEYIRDCVRQCRAADVRVYVKQLWMERCSECNRTWPIGTRAEHETCPDCGIGRLRPKLCHDPAEFPEDLRDRDLPWKETE